VSLSHTKQNQISPNVAARASFYEQNNNNMTIIRLLSSTLLFIGINLFLILIFSISNFVILGGKEKTGTFITLVTVFFLIFSIVCSGFITRKYYLHLKEQNFTSILFISIIVLAVIICTMLFFNLTSFVLSTE